ncbi:hypothetical protein [Sandaracinus amylolyticus]|uniref:hypothetical protein n=1 Tax=Sandaracinus amylolyticus TaxID=927083 RepID=UPI001F20DF54|nr:hypothetical protein [Sandaracinus amylolyticus]
MTLLVVEPDEGVRSELVLDLFLHGACVLVAERVDEALELMRAVRIDCVLAAPPLAPVVRAHAAEERALAGVPVVTRDLAGSSAVKVVTVEA